MKFYSTENLEHLGSGAEIKTTGMDMLIMSKVFKAIGKDERFKSIDPVLEQQFILLTKPYSINNDNGVTLNHKSKNLNFALISDKSIFEITKTKNKIETIYYAAIYADTLYVEIHKDKLEAKINKSTIESSNPIEQKAISWLDNGRVGLSSGTMCATLFPNLKNHVKLADRCDYDGNYEINWPHDSDDFGRCMKFLEAVPEARQRLTELTTLSNEWNKLISRWDEIETTYNKQNLCDTSRIIRECLTKPKIKP